MNKYEIYLTTGETVTVKADNFDIAFDTKRLIFTRGVKNIAIFVNDNICGFKKIDEEE